MNILQSLCRPKLKSLLENELYQTERDVLGLQDRVYRYEVGMRKAQAELACTQGRLNQIRAELARENGNAKADL